MDINNNTIIPGSTEVGMFKMKYFGGTRIHNGFFYSIFPFCTLCCVAFILRVTLMVIRQPQQFLPSPLHKTTVRGRDYLFLCISFGQTKLLLGTAQKISLRALLAKMHPVPLPTPVLANHNCQEESRCSSQGWGLNKMGS